MIAVPFEVDSSGHAPPYVWTLGENEIGRCIDLRVDGELYAAFQFDVYGGRHAALAAAARTFDDIIHQHVSAGHESRGALPPWH